ncbi:MAG: S41 family peptidase, partial [Bacteroidota bacterium]
GESQSQEIEVSCLSRDERFARLSSRYPEFPKTRDDLWTFKIIDAQVALLQINSFGLMGWKAMQLDYKQFLADVFQELKTKAIPHLIIDIRKNTGGNDEMADELFSYLSKSSFNYEREGRMRYLNFPENLKNFTQTWGNDPWYYNPQPEDRNPQNGYYIFKENFSQSAQKSRKTRFQGKVYMLCSHANTSLAFYTAARFQMQQLGLLIGQETGGNRNDINGGQILFLRLPQSKIEIDFPVMGGFSLQPQVDAGISPDIKVKYRIQDVIAGKDLEVEKVLELIKKE